MRELLRVVAAFAVTVFVYVCFIAVTVDLQLGEGSGLGCSGTECGPIADWFARAAPWPAILAAFFSCLTGLAAFTITRRRAAARRLAPPS